MNKNIKKAICFVSITLFMPSYGILNNLREKAYKAYENPKVYRTGIIAIDATAKVLSNTAIKLAAIPRLKENSEQKKQRLDKYIDTINLRLARIESNIRQDEKNTINALYREFNVLPEQQQKIETFANQFKQLEKEYMSHPHEETRSDAIIDGGPFMPALFKTCGIHPDGVKKEISLPPSTINQYAYALSRSIEAELTIDNDDNMTISKVLNPPTVAFYPLFFELSKVSQNAILAHEYGHIAAQHELTKRGLIFGISNFTGTELEKIISNNNFNKLVTIYERQAEILYKDAQWAEIMRQGRSSDSGYYPNQLFLRHYAQLAEIDELHKLKDKIKKL